MLRFIAGRDYSVVMGITVMLSAIIILANLVVDILGNSLGRRRATGAALAGVAAAPGREPYPAA